VSPPHVPPGALRRAVARFDDARPGGSALVLSRLRRELVATTPAEVPAVLSAVEAEARQGSFVAGYLAYEAAGGLGTGLSTAEQAPGRPFAELPLAWFGAYGEQSAAEPLRRHGGPPAPAVAETRRYEVGDWQLDVDSATYRSRVGVIREAIAAGVTYQCNYTVPLRSRAAGDLEALYRDLARAQGAGHCAFVDTGRFVVASASPELFFERRGDIITTKPMKGTATRSSSPAEDAEHALSLQRSAKERAENLMIVDLLRSDLGRIADFGSVEVPRLFELEPYENVWQLTSTIRGRTRPGTDLAAVFGALFPSGSVTGAPKHSTMRLIARLEPSPRGVYCGAVGLVVPEPGGCRARFNVAIRTAVIDRSTGDAVFGAGGAITWDSDPVSERAELLAKASILAALAPRRAQGARRSIRQAPSSRR
jgi:para-aminobenzoate synthetase / 4-amino-4-deoxychorismate lyase